MAPRRPERLYGIARQLLDVAVAGLDDHTQGGAPARQYVSDGPLIAWDCEQVVVTVESTLGHEGDVTTEVASPVNCLMMRAAQLGIWVVRCAPTVTEDGLPPLAQDVDDNAAVVLTDVMVLADVVADAYRRGELLGCHGLAFQQWQGIGPEGGLVGGVLRVRVDLTAV